MKASRIWILPAAMLALLAVPACGSEEASRPAGSGSEDVSTEDRPTSFSTMRSAILAAAESGEYEGLRPLIDADTFLSDFGYRQEPDPVGRWQALGSRPLETMAAVLRMPHAVRETNEGTLYQWPSYGANSRADDLSAEDRELFLTIMSKDELEQLILPELGYTGPRLGILSAGTWWFFILEGGA